MKLVNSLLPYNMKDICEEREKVFNLSYSTVNRIHHWRPSPPWKSCVVVQRCLWKADSGQFETAEQLQDSTYNGIDDVSVEQQLADSAKLRALFGHL